MSTVIVEHRTRPTTHPFPGGTRWAAAALLVTGALLQVIEFLLERPAGGNAARVAYWSDHLTRIGISEAVGLLAVPFLIGGFAVSVALTRGRSPRLAWAAACFLTCAMVGLAAVHGAEMIAYGLVRTGNTAAAVSALDGADMGLPGPVLLILFMGGAVLGTLTLAAAQWRSPFVPRVVPLFVLAFAILDFAVGWGVVSHSVALVGNVILAWAVVTGYSRSAPNAAE
ncbi:MAG TPA: hypothetical protein VH502_11925 [Actinoplanes sp.]|jgi:hypothetical protein